MLGNPEAYDHTLRFACRTSQQFRRFAGIPCGIDRGGKQIGRARWVPIEVGSAAFRALWPAVSD